MLPGVVRVPVEEDVDQGRLAEHLVELVAVAQVLVVELGAANDVVMDRRQAEPAVVAVPRQVAGEPAELGLADPAVVIIGLVTLGHGRVEAGYDHLQVGHLEQRPGLVWREAGGRRVAVELGEHRRELLPFRPVRRRGQLLGGSLGGEVTLAGRPVHVVVARHDRDMASGQSGGVGQLGQELQYLAEFAGHALLGQIAGDDDQIRAKAVLGGKVI